MAAGTTVAAVNWRGQCDGFLRGELATMADDVVCSLTERLRAGDDEAAGQLVRRFTARLIALASSRLDGLLSSKVDPEDLVQSVYKSFLKRLRAGDCQFNTWDELWAYLVLLTVRKCWDRRRYHRAARRDVGRERSLSLADENELAALGAMTRDPTPAQAAMLVETIEKLMAGLSQRDREILSLYLQGFTIAEISLRTGRAQRTVRRTIARGKQTLRTMYEGE